MTQPIGYWVSAPKGHTDHYILETIEQEFGSYLERFDESGLRSLLLLCSANNLIPIQSLLVENRDPKSGLGRAVDLITSLDEKRIFEFVPFLYELIRSYPCWFNSPRHREWYQEFEKFIPLFSKSAIWRIALVFANDENGIKRTEEDQREIESFVRELKLVVIPAYENLVESIV